MSLLSAPQQNGLLSPLKAQRVSIDGISQTFSSGVAGFTPTAAATDIAAMTAGFEGRVISIKRISVSAVADAPGSLDLLLQRSPNGGGGISSAQYPARHDSLDSTPTGSLLVFSSNRTSLGNGVSNDRPVIRSAKLAIGTMSSPENPLVFDFGVRGGKGLMIRNLVEWVVLNLNGQAIPAGLKLNIDIEWTEERLQKIIMVGDSTTSNANFMHQYIRNQVGINSQRDVRNYGSNGFRLTDFINNTNGVTYPLSAAINAIPEQYSLFNDKIVICYGINDVRQGGTSQSQLTALLDTAITTIKTALPDVEVILWGPNSLTSDDPGSTGYLTPTGIFNGMTLAQAAQSATDILYNSYQSFVGDPRVFAVLQKQDVFGRVCKTVAASGLMNDILHPNARGQKLSGQQILPYLLR